MFTWTGLGVAILGLRCWTITRLASILWHWICTGPAAHLISSPTRRGARGIVTPVTKTSINYRKESKVLNDQAKIRSPEPECRITFTIQLHFHILTWTRLCVALSSFLRTSRTILSTKLWQRISARPCARLNTPSTRFTTG